jgi:hypothetical protein
MKRLIYLSMGFALLVGGCGDGVVDSVSDLQSLAEDITSSPAAYFPLKEGLTWTYGSREDAIRVTASNPSIYGPIYSVTGFLQDRELRTTYDGKVMELRGDSWRLLFDLSADVKDSWTIQTKGEQTDLLDGATVTVESRSDRVSTPYGDFDNAVHLSVRPRDGLNDAGVTQMWFTPGVGLVKWSETWIGGERLHLLAGFDDGGA